MQNIQLPGNITDGLKLISAFNDDSILRVSTAALTQKVKDDLIEEEVEPLDYHYNLSLLADTYDRLWTNPNHVYNLSVEDLKMLKEDIDILKPIFNKTKGWADEMIGFVDTIINLKNSVN